jgi:hypothetical protein
MAGSKKMHRNFNEKSAVGGHIDNISGAMGRRIEEIPIERLKPYGANARTHSRRQIKLIARSIKRYGFINPLLIDGDNRIIAGHGRVAAARELGLLTVPAVRINHLKEADLRAYVLADNKLAELAGWDRDILTIELQGLIEIGYDIEYTGFTTEEIDFTANNVDRVSSDSSTLDDDIPDLKDPPAVRPGELWLLDQHRMLCGNADQSINYFQLLNGRKVDLALISAPRLEVVNFERLFGAAAAVPGDRAVHLILWSGPASLRRCALAVVSMIVSPMYAFGTAARALAPSMYWCSRLEPHAMPWTSKVPSTNTNAAGCGTIQGLIFADESMNSASV